MWNIKMEFYSCLATLKLSLYFLLSYTDTVYTRPADHIVNPHPFTYHINNENICNDNTDTLIWVHSAPNHFRHRMFLRDTWANPAQFSKRNVSLVFFIGLSKKSFIQDKLEYESESYNDIVQETFIDSYKNLTYKAIAGCKWTSNYCKSAKLVIKADDDAGINLDLLFQHIDSLQKKGKVLNNTILCNVIHNAVPIREDYKWQVTKEEYPEEEFPPYCPGLGLTITGDVIPKLYNQSLYEPFFWVDDIYLTGLLTRALDITLEPLGGLVDYRQFTKKQNPFKIQPNGIFYHIDNKPSSWIMWKEAYMEREGLFYELMPPSG